jgi:hypothetical protein
MVPWHPTFRICRSTWVKGDFVSHDWILSSESIFSFTGVAYAAQAVRERGTLTRSKVACPLLFWYSSDPRFMFMFLSVMNKTLSAFFCFFFSDRRWAVQHMFNLSVVEIPQLLNSGTKVLPCPKASVPHVLPLGFAAGTRAPKVHVLHTPPYPTPNIYILLRLWSPAPRRKSLGTTARLLNGQLPCDLEMSERRRRGITHPIP